MKRWIVLAFAIAAVPAAAQPAYDMQAERAFVEQLLARMTVEEKLGQLTQYPGEWTSTGPWVSPTNEGEIRAGRVGSFFNIFGAETTKRLQRIAVEESRLGIPILFGADVIHGHRTVFPVPLGEAASWNLEAIERGARIAAVEASAAGIQWTFAPMVDIARDARWGRIAEGAGEDTYLGSRIAEARVRGFQGTTLAGLSADSTVLATAKHFAAYGAAEAGREYNATDISERTLRDVYLPPFQAAVDASVQSLMSGFNDLGGVPATANHHLLTEILRKEWGFGGFVVSDYTSIFELMNHGIAADSAEAGRRAMMAGVDMSMVDGIYMRNLPPLVASGALPMPVLDEAVRRVLRAKYRAGLFADPYRYNDPVREVERTLTPAHRRAARAIATQSIVMLKNDGDVLPLSRTPGRVAVIGALASDSLSALGSWVLSGRKEDAIPILAGIREALPGADVRFEPGYPPVVGGSFEQAVAAMLDTDTSGHDAAVALARSSDVIVLVLGEHRELAGEATSRADIGLPGAQETLARRVIEAAGGKPLVVLLTNGRPLAIPYLADAAPAILVTWQLGVEMGHAVADILFGDANPSGKLPVTFPRATGQEPLYYNLKPTGRPPTTAHKYNSKYVDVDWTPLYPFGFGLSYTTFAYDRLALSAPRIGLRDALTVSVEVTNTGTRAGAEVVQLYVRDEAASVTRPVRELKGFQRIELAPGERRTVTFVLRPEDLRFWGLDDAWTVEPGWFTVYAGPSSVQGLEARFELTH
ncbi:MAG: beta-glucosidase BglX [Rhodothermales bacterium]